METDKLIFTQMPHVELASNMFINVPVILQYDNTPLIEVIRDLDIEYKTQYSVYHQDGTYLAKVKGSKLFATEDGKKAGVQIRHLSNTLVCELGKNTIFEITKTGPFSVKTTAELYTNNGSFIKSSPSDLTGFVLNQKDNLQIKGLRMSKCTFSGVKIGVWVKSDGSISIGCN